MSAGVRVRRSTGRQLSLDQADVPKAATPTPTPKRERLTGHQRRHVERLPGRIRTLARWFAGAGTPLTYDDFVGIGCEAAATVVLRFDPRHHPAFHVFAYKRIHGAMHDAARVSLLRSREELVLTPMLERDATSDDEALDFFAELRGPSASDRHEGVGITLGRFDGELAVGILGGGFDLDEDGIGHVLDRGHQLRLLEVAIADRGYREGAFVRGFYFEEKTLEVLAAELGMSKRNVQRVHDRSRERLAVRLGAVVHVKRGSETSPAIRSQSNGAVEPAVRERAVVIRLSEIEHRRAAQLARDAGLTLGEWARRRTTGEAMPPEGSKPPRTRARGLGPRRG